MGFRVSPGVTVTEKDLTTVVPAVATTRAGIAGVFRWGPVNKITLVTSEDDLVRSFGKPTALNPETFFTAASFLTYGNALQVVRAANTSGATGDIANTALNAVANVGATSNLIMLGAVVKNYEHYLTVDGTFDSAISYIAKYPGDLGNSLKISVCDSANAFTSDFSLFPNANFTVGNVAFTMNSNTATAAWVHSGGGSNTDTAAIATAFAAALTVGDQIKVGNTTIGEQYMKITSIGAPASLNATTHYVTVNFAEKFRLGADWSSTNTISRYWEYHNLIDHAPNTSNFVLTQGNVSAQDTLHIVVADQDGKFTGTPGAVLETFPDMSRATDAVAENGTSIYYKDVINSQSQYIWWAAHRSNAPANTAINIASSTNVTPQTISFVNGADGKSEALISLNNLTIAWDYFRNTEQVDVSLLLAGLARGTAPGTTLANYLIALCEQRKDCMVFISPEQADVVNAQNSEYSNIKTFRDSLSSSSFAVLDSGYKYAYDKYLDTYRWVPLNGDIAGLLARTEVTRDAWWSPAGFNRGGIANVVKLAWNPSEPNRDLLYKADINPVATFPGQGTILFGDKTLLGKPSAFDRINVRRLFIVLEKAIATAANFTLFEFNDSFTRSTFRNIVEPFLRTVQGRRGITDFKVVCDETNNTGEVIDRNEFVGDIYIKPARSINFIRLNFVAVKTGVEFSEVVGRA